ALIWIGVATLIAVSTAWPQGPPADAPSRVPPGPPPATTDADVAGLLRDEPTGLSLLRPYRRGRIPVIFIHGLWSRALHDWVEHGPGRSEYTPPGPPFVRGGKKTGEPSPFFPPYEG